MEIDYWTRHFRRDRERPALPGRPAGVSPTSPVLLASLKRMRNSHAARSGLLSRDSETHFEKYPEMRLPFELWFGEKRAQTRLLGETIECLGGRQREDSPSHPLSLPRKIVGVRFEIFLLLVGDLVARSYFVHLRNRKGDAVLRGVCHSIIQDTTAHLAFHRSRLAFGSDGQSRLGKRWETSFYLLTLILAASLWFRHRNALEQSGSTAIGFLLDCLEETERFIRKTRNLRKGGPRRAAEKMADACWNPEPRKQKDSSEAADPVRTS